MALIPNVGRKSWSVRLTTLSTYAALILLGATMVVPFMITVSMSITNGFDYDRFWLVPRYFWSEPDRFMRGLFNYFNSYSQWNSQMSCNFRDMPSHWSSWREIGRDRQGVDALAAQYLNRSPEEMARWKQVAADYSAFVESYPIDDTECTISNVQVTRFLMEHYEQLWSKQHPDLSRQMGSSRRNQAALNLLGETWQIPFPDFYSIGWSAEASQPMWQQTWFPPENEKYVDFQLIKQMYREHYFTPGVQQKWLRFLQSNNWKIRDRADVFPIRTDSPEELRRLWSRFRADIAPASPSTPLALRPVWRNYLQSEEVQALLQLPKGRKFDADTYNRLAGTNYRSLFDTPFPVPSDSQPGIQALWRRFVETRYPVRLTRIRVTSELTHQYQQLLATRFRTIEYVNRLFGTDFTRWDQFDLTATAPVGRGSTNLRSVWIDFVKNLPAAQRILTSSEHAYQQFLLEKYGSLGNINKIYGWNLRHIEEAFPRFDVAYAITFFQNEGPMTRSSALSNYSVIMDYLLRRGNAVPVTLFLVALAILSTLTVNPMAAYALSRFNMKGQDKIILFMLATTAFPAMVSAIPAYLLMRDLGLLNTFLALILPGAANGMSIFILKGFFDSLPQELYDAATIDGAKEWQVFAWITLPMMKPILAINALGAFLWAYSSWDWALIVCQEQKMWTLAVWMYQANQWWASTPWVVTAGFVVISIPTLLVFLFCQKIILRGIIIPSMK